MTHVEFDPDAINWGAYLDNQEGRGRYFEGTRYQRGYGILQNIGKFLLPVVKNLAVSAGEEGIAAGTRVLKDLSEGKNFADSLKEQTTAGLKTLGRKVHQCGKGKRRPRDQLSVL